MTRIMIAVLTATVLSGPVMGQQDQMQGGSAQMNGVQGQNHGQTMRKHRTSSGTMHHNQGSRSARDRTMSRSMQGSGSSMGGH